MASPVTYSRPMPIGAYNSAALSSLWQVPQAEATAPPPPQTLTRDVLVTSGRPTGGVAP